jgi:release factor glutamine methyltransferase
MSESEAWTIGKLLTWTTDYLKKHGSQSPRLDAEVLLAHARKCQRIELYTAFGEEPNDEVKDAFRQMVRKRAEGTPVAYLVGYKEFYATLFDVTADVLIPRPETEHLVIEAIDRAKQLRQAQPDESARTLRIADVGTGSGIIAISVAKQLGSACQVTAIDLSAAALDVARRNAERYQLGEDRIRFQQGDLLEACNPAEPFDLILSNPPYVSEAEFQLLDRSVREFEPRQALVAGPSGAEIIVRLIEQAGRYLTADGFLIFEFSPMLAKQLDSWIDAGWQSPHITKDLAGLARIVTLRKLRPEH